MLNFRKKAWDVLRSPKALAALKLGAAIIGLIHSIDELINASKQAEQKIGFKIDDN